MNDYFDFGDDLEIHYYPRTDSLPYLSAGERQSAFYFEISDGEYLMRYDLGYDESGYRTPLFEENKVDVITAQSNIGQIPSAKAVYDFVMSLINPGE